MGEGNVCTGACHSVHGGRRRPGGTPGYTSTLDAPPHPQRRMHLPSTGCTPSPEDRRLTGGRNASEMHTCSIRISISQIEQFYAEIFHIDDVCVQRIRKTYPAIIGKQFRLRMSPFCTCLEVTGL